MHRTRAEEHTKRVSDWLHQDLKVPTFFSEKIARVSGVILGLVASDDDSNNYDRLETYIPSEPNSGSGIGYFVSGHVKIEHTITASDSGIPPGGANGDNTQ